MFKPRCTISFGFKQCHAFASTLFCVAACMLSACSSDDVDGDQKIQPSGQASNIPLIVNTATAENFAETSAAQFKFADDFFAAVTETLTGQSNSATAPQAALEEGATFKVPVATESAPDLDLPAGLEALSALSGPDTGCLKSLQLTQNLLDIKKIVSEAKETTASSFAQSNKAAFTVSEVSKSPAQAIHYTYELNSDTAKTSSSKIVGTVAAGSDGNQLYVSAQTTFQIDLKKFFEVVMKLAVKKPPQDPTQPVSSATPQALFDSKLDLDEAASRGTDTNPTASSKPPLGPKDLTLTGQQNSLLTADVAAKKLRRDEQLQAKSSMKLNSGEIATLETSSSVSKELFAADAVYNVTSTNDFNIGGKTYKIGIYHKLAKRDAATITFDLNWLISTELTSKNFVTKLTIKRSETGSCAVSFEPKLDLGALLAEKAKLKSREDR